MKVFNLFYQNNRQFEIFINETEIDINKQALIRIHSSVHSAKEISDLTVRNCHNYVIHSLYKGVWQNDLFSREINSNGLNKLAQTSAYISKISNFIEYSQMLAEI